MTVKVEKLRFVDLDKASNLIHKFWDLNSEFEPALELDEGYLEEINENVKMSIADKRQIVLVAKDEERVVGLIRVEVRDNSYYGKKPVGKIIELYVIPTHRKMGVAVELLDGVVESLRGQDIELLMAEFPTQNVLAASFYEANSFNPFITVYAKRLKP